MRELSVNEIAILEEQGCSAEDWAEILVDEDFTTSSVRDVAFYGHVELGSLNGSMEVEDGFWRRSCLRNVTLRNVTIGDECIIENIRGYISDYKIGNRCYISDCGIIMSQGVLPVVLVRQSPCSTKLATEISCSTRDLPVRWLGL